MEKIKAYLIKNDGIDFYIIPEQIDGKTLTNARYKIVFKRSQGFETIQDVKDYINKYFVSLEV